MSLFGWRRKHSKNAWYHLYLNQAQLDSYEQARLELAFETAYMQARRPRHMNLWIESGTESGANFYMSPASRLPAHQLIARYRAQASGQPLKPLLLVAGFRHKNAALPTNGETAQKPLPALARAYRSPRLHLVRRSTEAGLVSGQAMENQMSHLQRWSE